MSDLTAKDSVRRGNDRADLNSRLHRAWYSYALVVVIICAIVPPAVVVMSQSSSDADSVLPVPRSELLVGIAAWVLLYALLFGLGTWLFLRWRRLR